MAKLTVVKYPHPTLKVKSAKITNFDDKLRELADNMLETMYAASGVGLAANQVNVAQRIFVMDCSDARDQPYVFINPEIVEKHGEKIYDEGCLSFPGLYTKVKRADRIKVKYFDVDGNEHSLEAHGLLSNCIQHELDHIDGIVFIDRLSQLKRTLALKKLKKLESEEKRRNNSMVG